MVHIDSSTSRRMLPKCLFLSEDEEANSAYVYIFMHVSIALDASSSSSL